MKRRVRSATEQDVVYARRIYCWLQKAGATAAVKRQIRRRERREGKLAGMERHGQRAGLD